MFVQLRLLCASILLLCAVGVVPRAVVSPRPNTLSLASSSQNHGGSFIALSEAASDAATPLALILGGFNEQELSAIDDVSESLMPGSRVSSVVVLDEADRQRDLSSLLRQPALDERDHELPKNPMAIEIPLVLFSGFTSTEVRNMMAGIRQTFAARFGYRSQGGDIAMQGREIVFAIAVRNALEKRIDALYSEVVGDYEANKK